MATQSAIFGFDLGHGETALAFLGDALSQRGKHGVHPQCVFTPPTQPTVFFKDRGCSAWGDQAIALMHTNGDCALFEVGFKDKPKHYDEAKRLLTMEYAKTVIDQAFSQHSHFKNNCSVWIGCPSGWSDVDIEEYTKLFEEAGLPNPSVCRESRAAFAYHYNLDPDRFKLGSVEQGVVVFDFGSSTLDATLAIGMGDDILDPGQPFGATWVDKAILLWNIRYWDSRECSRERLLELLSDRTVLMSAELKARQAKEQYYQRGGQQTYPNAKRSCRLAFEVDFENLGILSVNGEMMREILNTPLRDIIAQLASKSPSFGEHNGFPVLAWDSVPEETRDAIGARSWLELCRAFVESSMAALSEKRSINAISHVVLTGGASRMPEIREIVSSALNGANAKMVPDDEPSLAVAKGLACFGRIEHQTLQFSQEVNAALFDSDLGFKQIIGEELQKAEYETIVGEKFFDLFRDQLVKWQEREQSGEAVRRNLKRNFDSWVHGDQFTSAVEKETHKCQDAVNRRLNELVKPIMKKYHIANAAFIGDLYFPDVMKAICSAIGEAVVELIGSMSVLDELGNRPGFFASLFADEPDLNEYLQRVTNAITKMTVNAIYQNDELTPYVVGSLIAGYQKNIEDAITNTKYMIVASS